jgi:hypothetical protein
VSDRVRQLAERQAELQVRCAAQRALVAAEVAAIEERFESVDRIARVARATLLHPAVIAGGVLAVLTVGRSRGMRLVGRLYLLSTAARRLMRTVKVFQGLLGRAPSAQTRGERL